MYAYARPGVAASLGLGRSSLSVRFGMKFICTLEHNVGGRERAAWIGWQDSQSRMASDLLIRYEKT